jgi:glycerol-3-phosphate dehydrogenase (NAD(P)+)
VEKESGICVGLVGLGNLGTAIGNLVANNGYDVVGWEYHASVVEEINSQHTNARFLRGVALNLSLTATSDLQAAVDRAEIVFVAIPSAYIRSTLEPVADQVGERNIVVNMAKGIDADTGLTAYQTVSRLFPKARTMMLSGPSIADEFARGLPTVVVLGGAERVDLLAVSRVLENSYFRTRFSDDALGIELGGILKNVYAIGLGLFDGKGITSVNFRSVYLTIALEEMTKLGVGLGAKAETFSYLAGLGDLLATSLSSQSHNRGMGELLAQGHSLDTVEKRMGVLPEGFKTLRMALDIAEKLHIPLPLARGLWDVIHGRFEAEAFIFAFIRDFVE